jgi:hypothetical protein
MTSGVGLGVPPFVTGTGFAGGFVTITSLSAAYPALAPSMLMEIIAAMSVMRNREFNIFALRSFISQWQAYCLPELASPDLEDSAGYHL